MKKFLAWFTGDRVADALYEQSEDGFCNAVLTFCVIFSVLLVYARGLNEIIKWVF